MVSHVCLPPFTPHEAKDYSTRAALSSGIRASTLVTLAVPTLRRVGHPSLLPLPAASASLNHPPDAVAAQGDLPFHSSASRVRGVSFEKAVGLHPIERAAGPRLNAIATAGIAPSLRHPPLGLRRRPSHRGRHDPRITSRHLSPTAPAPRQRFVPLVQRTEKEKIKRILCAGVPVMRTCQALTRSGTPCRMAPQSGSDYCFTHNPENAAVRPEIAAAAGRSSGASRRKVPVPPEALELSSSEGLRVLFSSIIAAELDGRIAPTRTRNIMRIIENLPDDAYYQGLQ